MRTNPFCVQEGVVEPKTILEASAGEIAELPAFREALLRLLEAYNTMGAELELVPDVPALTHRNVLVDSEGHIYVVDTNTLVSPGTYDRFGFHFAPEIERLIHGLEAGHVKGNPQG